MKNETNQIDKLKYTYSEAMVIRGSCYYQFVSKYFKSNSFVPLSISLSSYVAAIWTNENKVAFAACANCRLV